MCKIHRNSLNLLTKPLCLCLAFCLMFIPTVHASTSYNNSDILFERNINSESSDYNFSYTTDNEGNIYGPEDFAVDQNRMFILDSAKNSICQYVSNNLERIYDMNDHSKKAIKISAKEGSLFVLNSDLTVSVFDTSGEYRNYNISDELINKAISDFTIKGNYLFVSTTEWTSGKTYRFGLSNFIAPLETIEGRIVDEETSYKVKLIPEGNRDIGHSCILSINQKNLGVVDLKITTNNWLYGAQYLGKNDSDEYIVKTYEMIPKSKSGYQTIEKIRLVASDSSSLDLFVVPNQRKSISNQTKSFEGTLYHLNNTQLTVEILKIKDNEVPLPYQAKPLKFLASTKTSMKTDNNLTRTSISRSSIIANATSFHTGFSWSCTSANLAPLANWTKPRYINAAGNYTCMPYCWGGFSTTTSFTNGLQNGGRVGNINSASSSWVSGTYGLDCSGYISRCWGLATKYGTWTIQDVSTEIDISDLLQGDALVDYDAHIVLFNGYTQYGDFDLYECTTLNGYDRVAHTTRTVSSMASDYVPIRYDDVQ